MHNHSDFLLNLAWFIPLVTFAAFVAVPLFTYRNRKLSHSLVIGAIAIAFVLAQIVFWRAVTLPVGGGEHAYESPAYHWLSAGLEQFDIAVYIDPATTVMLFMMMRKHLLYLFGLPVAGSISPYQRTIQGNFLFA